jgi:hypothetical protein
VDSDQPLVELADHCGGQRAVTLASLVFELVTLDRLARERPVLLDERIHADRRGQPAFQPSGEQAICTPS